MGEVPEVPEVPPSPQQQDVCNLSTATQINSVGIVLECVLIIINTSSVVRKICDLSLICLSWAR